MVLTWKCGKGPVVRVALIDFHQPASEKELNSQRIRQKNSQRTEEQAHKDETSCCERVGNHEATNWQTKTPGDVFSRVWWLFSDGEGDGLDGKAVRVLAGGVHNVGWSVDHDVQWDRQHGRIRGCARASDTERTEIQLRRCIDVCLNVPV